MINGYDFEVFAHDWMVVIVNPFERTDVTIHNDVNKLRDYYERHKDQIWVGYNSREYDTYILKGILLGFDPKEINDFIIKEKRKGWMYSSLFNKIKLYNYDVMTTPHSLKTLEAFMGDDIEETSVPFDIDRPLTPNEIKLTEHYCHHDVEETLKIFLRRKNDFDTHMQLITTFVLPMTFISKTKAQISAEILGCQRPSKEWDDEWDIEIVPTIRLDKYWQVKEWFLNPVNHRYKDGSGKKMKYVCRVAGVEHTFGYGGLHGALEQYHDKGMILHIDVESFYPALMIEYGLLSRNVHDPRKYKMIRDKRVKYKKDKNPIQKPYKIVLNGTYGICKDKYSKAYDPRQANRVCVNGQLMLLDLIERLEDSIPSFKLIQSNTDGLIVKIEECDFELLDDVCYEWEQRCHMKLGFDFISEIWQKDVNNYVFVTEEGEVERKGAYVKELNDLDNNLAIVNEAMVDYMINGKPIEQSIYECKDFSKFQMAVKVSGNYEFAVYNGNVINGKCHRVFASKCEEDGGIFKSKGAGKTNEKFANTPDHCFIYNGNINNKRVPRRLDKDWYIALADKRLRQYGVTR